MTDNYRSDEEQGTVKSDKRLRKLAKHTTVKINNRNVKILNYKKDSYIDNYTKKKVDTIEFITKVHNEVFQMIYIAIELDENEVLYGQWSYSFGTTSSHRYKYNLIDKNDIPFE